MSFDPELIRKEILRDIPNFKMVYQPDPVRQAIAESWPDKMDDTCAKEEWGWKPEYDLESMTKDMIETLKKRFNK